MKRFGLAFTISSALTVVPQHAVSQNPQDMKHLLTTMPEGKGRIELIALNIDRSWTPPVVHLKGNVRIEIRTSPKNAREVTILHADEAEYHEDTGEILPRGNVRVTIEEAK